MLTREWLLAQGACGPDLERSVKEFGETIAVSRVTIQRASEFGINVLWVGCRLIGQSTRNEFIDFTLNQRRAALETMLGRAAPREPDALRTAAVAARQKWSATGDIQARSLAIGLRDFARDGVLRDPSPNQAEESALAAQRAISYAGGDQAAAKVAQEEWLTRMIEEPKGDTDTQGAAH